MISILTGAGMRAGRNEQKYQSRGEILWARDKVVAAEQDGK